MHKIHSTTISTGFAIFSMFFGAGNIVYPLAMGQYAQDHNFYALIGFLLTGVGVPLLGVLAMTLFDGDHRLFFFRLGKIPGFLVYLTLLAFIGPLGALPRLIAFAYSTTKLYLPNLSIGPYSFFACLLIFLLSYRRRRLLDILGYFLTPLLLLSLAWIIIKGIWMAPHFVPAEDGSLSIFLHGLQQGYKTMDLPGAFFFSYVVILCLKKEIPPIGQKESKHLMYMVLKAGYISAFLLGLIYVGLSYLASFNSEILAAVPQDEMLPFLSQQILGPYAAFAALTIVITTCLTTAIALAAIFAEFIHEDLTHYKFSYPVSLMITLIIAFFFATLKFEDIHLFLSPVLVVCYPSLILLTGLNVLYKLYKFQAVKTPVLVAFLLTLLTFFL